MVITNFTTNRLIRVAEDTALDYFYRMGGANCYRGYDNWHALALVVFLYHEKDNYVLTQALENEDWIDNSLWWKCDELVQKVRSELQDVEADVADYIDWADKHVVTGLFANPSRKHEWYEFKTKLDDLLKKCANPEHSCEGRAKGAILGLAIGDAMGAPVEFRPRGKFVPVTGFRDGGPFKLKAGQWTDDTAMALCLATSLIECNGMDAKDQMDRYLRWVNDGYMSCTGKAVGIGQTVLRSLVRYHNTQDPYQGSTSVKHAGNGCIMRLAPVPIFFHDDAEKAVLNSVDSARTTHASPQALQTTAYFAGLIWGALNSVSKDELLEPYYTPMDDLSFTDLHEDAAEVIAGNYKNKTPEELTPSGYAPQSLEVALWAFYHSDNFEEGLLMAVNMGGDADTIGAIYGQLAGAFYGYDAIPISWIPGLDTPIFMTDIITAIVQRVS